jgi:hypothetical protein
MAVRDVSGSAFPDLGATRPDHVEDDAAADREGDAHWPNVDACHLATDTPAVDVPVQFFQSTIAIELAVAGALLWEIRYFERGTAATRDRQSLPDPRLQLFFAFVMGATLFGSLWAIADGGKAVAATLVTTGVAVSLLPVLFRVLPPLARDARTTERHPDYAVTVIGLVLYVAVVGGVIALINVD